MPIRGNPPQSLRRRPLSIAVALALTGAPAGAATLPVTGDCLLADAITAANSNTAVGGCPAGDDQDNGGDIIELSADVILSTVDNSTADDGANGLPVVSSTITINGHGHTLARSDAGGNPFAGGIPFFRLLHVAHEGRLTLNGITLENGWVSGSGVAVYGGGGLLNHGHAALAHSLLSHNGADFSGGVHNEGTLTLTRTMIADNFAGDGVGGLGNSGSATITYSTVSSNSGVEEGGIANFPSGTLTLTHSTVADNEGWADGAGLWNMGMLTVTNSTISGNDLGLGVLGGSAALIHTTLAGNGINATYGGGGLRVFSGSATLTNSLLANNREKDCEGDVTFEGLNLIGDGSCDALEAGQLTGDPHLGPLADNGGPTWTHALLAGSPARDKIPFSLDVGCEPTEVIVDQRGVSRPQPAEGKCDIGAFERIQPLSIETILKFFDNAAAAGNLEGQGPGRSAISRLNTLRNQLRVLSLRSRQGGANLVCGRLDAALKHVHPGSPNAFVTGPAVNELAVMLRDWGAALNCRSG